MKEKNIKRYSKLALIGFVFAILSIMNTLIFIIRNIQDPFFVLYLEYDAIFIAIGFLLLFLFAEHQANQLPWIYKLLDQKQCIVELVPVNF